VLGGVLVRAGDSFDFGVKHSFVIGVLQNKFDKNFYHE